MTGNKNENLQRIAQAGLMAALCYIGYAVFPAITATGTKIHVGNAFVVLAAYLLGGVYGGLSGAVGLSIADITGGYVAATLLGLIGAVALGIGLVNCLQTVTVFGLAVGIVGLIFILAAVLVATCVLILLARNGLL